MDSLGYQNNLNTNNLKHFRGKYHVSETKYITIDGRIYPDETLNIKH